jgi:hypothetical protein
MQRLIEQLADEGNVLVKGRQPLGRVRYHLSVYQHFSPTDGEQVPASLKIEGHITPLDAFDLGDLLHGRSELTLQLADGQSVDFFVTHADGTIRSSGRGLYRTGP